jgi:hypothetical protein
MESVLKLIRNNVWARRVGILVVVIAVVAWFWGFSAERSTTARVALTDQQKECLQAATSANFHRSEALRSNDKENVLSMFSVERTIAERRLDELYCLHLTQCTFQPESLDGRWHSAEFGIAFRDCLEDEMRDQYELPPRERRKPKPKPRP